MRIRQIDESEWKSIRIDENRGEAMKNNAHQWKFMRSMRNRKKCWKPTKNTVMTQIKNYSNGQCHLGHQPELEPRPVRPWASTRAARTRAPYVSYPPEKKAPYGPYQYQNFHTSPPLLGKGCFTYQAILDPLPPVACTVPDNATDGSIHYTYVEHPVYLQQLPSNYRRE